MIDIGQFRLAIQARTVRERVPHIEARLRDVVQGPLQRSLQALDEDALASAASTNSNSNANAMVFIDSMQLSLAINTQWSDDTLARHFASSVANAINQAIQAPSAGLRRFDDRASWLAHYLAARVSGQGDSQWWFDELEGLRLLPLASGLRSVLCSQGEDAFAAICQLNAPLLSQLLAGLGELEPVRVLKAWRERPSTLALPLAPLWRAALQTHDNSPAQVLLAAVALERGASGAINARSLDLLLALAQLVSGVRSTSRAQSLTNDLTQLCQDHGVAPTALLALNVEEQAELQQALQTLFAAQGAAPPQAHTAQATPDQDTPHQAPFQARSANGGVFVLSSVMQWRRWPELALSAMSALPDSTHASALCRALMLAVASTALADEQDNRRQPSALQDSALLSAFALPTASALLQEHGPAACAVLRLWLRDTTAVNKAEAGDEHAVLDALLRQAARILLEALATRVPGCAGASSAWLRANLLSSSAQLDFNAQTATLDVRLTRAPLHVLLLVAGLSQQRWRLGDWQVNITTEDLA